MTPDQCKRVINKSKENLLQLAQTGKINQSCIEGLLESQARAAARHNGIPNAWRNYMPELFT